MHAVRSMAIAFTLAAILAPSYHTHAQTVTFAVRQDVSVALSSVPPPLPKAEAAHKKIHRVKRIVNEKTSSAEKNYQPQLTVSTFKNINTIEVKIKDNGSGIPKKIIDKIFQPFFTTKPTGEGTGLGLSLSYDIVKTHGGEIKAESDETNGTTFIISLPL